MRTNGPGQSAHLLLDIIDLLEPFPIPYAVIGALAASFYGIPRFTADADATVWLDGTGKTGRDLRDLLTAEGYRVELRIGDIEDPIAGVVIACDQHDNQVDILLGVRGMDPGAAGRCLTTTLLGAPVQMIGVEDLIAMKLFAGGVQDLEDVRGILQVSKDHLDLALLQRLTDHYGTDTQRALKNLISADDETRTT